MWAIGDIYVKRKQKKNKGLHAHRVIRSGRYAALAEHVNRKSTMAGVCVCGPAVLCIKETSVQP